ncbi:lipoprotein [Stappia taiwanensis]|nr:lipoprotein [Stappia taiwanensis]
MLVFAALAAGCSGGVERFEEPIFTGNTDNQRALLMSGSVSQPSFDDVVAGPAKTQPVTRAALPPATSSNRDMATGSVPSASSSSGSYQQARVAPKPVPRASTGPAAASRPVATAPALTATAATASPRTVRGWTTAGATQVSARSGDSVSSMARRYGVPQYVLAEINNVPPNGRFSAGQQVVIPTYVYGARSAGVTRPAATATAPMRLPPAGAAPSVTGSIPGSAPSGGALAAVPRPSAKPAGTVQVASTAQTVPVVTLQAFPKSKPAKRATSGTRTAAVTPTKVAAVKPSKPSTSAEAAPTKPIKVSRPEADDSVRRFRWPVRGRIISEFGSKPGGTRNDGINLAVPEGADIKAVDDGTVIYAGNELKGYGNLVLIRHDDGWVSAYAHNSALLVKRGDSIRRGAVVAKAGSTGSVTQPQLHFELRRGNKPVDPMQYLARL